MVFATHFIKIYGKINIFIWPEKKLRNYVNKKIRTEIYSTFHAKCKLFKLEEEKIEVWVYISALPSEVSTNIVEKWINDCMVIRGLKIEKFEIEIIASKIDREFNKSKVLIYLE